VRRAGVARVADKPAAGVGGGVASTLC
jgi:hypothetical protein